LDAVNPSRWGSYRRWLAGARAGVSRSTGRLDELLAGARHAVERVAGRGVADSGLVEQAGIGGAGAGLTALAVKAVAVCVVVGGATVVCLDGSSHLTDHPAKAASPPHREAERVVELEAGALCWNRWVSARRRSSSCDLMTSEVFEYVEAFYNTTRRHSTLGYLSPAQFETESMTNNPKING
jgi:transposase InsO family protein